MNTFKNPVEAFNAAIKSGHLSERPKDSNYAGNYMYMHTDLQGDHFKYVMTRRYLVVAPNEYVGVGTLNRLYGGMK